MAVIITYVHRQWRYAIRHSRQ